MNKITRAIFRKLFPFSSIRKKLHKRIRRYEKKINQIQLLLLMKRVRIHQRKQIKRIREIRGSRKIRIVFFVLSNIGKANNVFENLYLQFLKSAYFDPYLIVSPYIYLGKKYMLETTNESYDYFLSKGYKVLNGYDSENNCYLDIKKSICPDIVFFMEPYDYLTPKECSIFAFLDTLSYYTPYSYSIALNNTNHFNTRVHNLVWTIFGESSYHKILAERYAYNKGSNFVGNLGYCKMDDFLSLTNCKDIWKKQNSAKKRIILAPHHLFSQYPNFLKFADFFVFLANHYINNVQFIFRPHPVLRESLYLHSDWGKERTDKYYDLWEQMENTQYESGEYKDMFFTSDAMILDSVSFMQEYIFTLKPLLVIQKNPPEKFNEFGEVVLSNCYTGSEERDILNFIDDVVLSGNDPKKKDREKFYNKYLLPPNGRTASENIYRYILNELEIE